jgi:arylsulfatase A-like enzyme
MAMTTLRTFFVVLFVLSSLTACGPRESGKVGQAETPPPNIIFILADDLGYSDLGCYGGEIDTPNLDRLADNGLRFTRHYNTARCWSSRAALLSGYYAQQINRDRMPGVGGGAPQKWKRPEWARLLPELLKAKDYRNYHSGKWHIDGPVLPAGFDRSFKMDHLESFFEMPSALLDDKPYPMPRNNKERYFNTIAVADHAIECLRDHKQNHADRPFFHYIAFVAPHFPLQALPEDIEKYRDRYLEGWDVMRQQRYQRQLEMGLVSTPLSEVERDLGPPYHQAEAYDILGSGEVRFPVPWDDLTEEQKRFQATKMAIHAAMVDRMDREIGRILQQLEEMGELNNTLIFFASDNGASAEIMVRGLGHDPELPMGSHGTYLCLGPGFSSACNTPFRRHKTWVHEGGISTPLIAHWPKGIKARGELRHTPGHFIDFVPTVLECADIEMPTTWKGEPIPDRPGRSLVPAFARDIAEPHPLLWWLHAGNRAFQRDDCKIVAAKGEAWELYYLKDDRAEQNDLADAMPEKVEELSALWQATTDEYTELMKETLGENALAGSD